MNEERPHNETPRDLSHESAARLAIERALDCQITNLREQLYGVDWVLHRDARPFAFGEYKHRGEADYDAWLLGAAKYAKGRQIAHAISAQFYFFVETKLDGLRYANLSAMPLLVTRMGGNARGQSGDIEPCVLIPAAYFKPIAEWST
jgi:hypothetical protein